ncbi:hypothetical protein LLT7_13630 [Lactococcus cremoris subsp. cremoris TIFN7]|nr:hypothetical protein LLT7_13630 [Lactococcus cremoris subsp. cremoris TIFN7]
MKSKNKVIAVVILVIISFGIFFIKKISTIKKNFVLKKSMRTKLLLKRKESMNYKTQFQSIMRALSILLLKLKI